MANATFEIGTEYVMLWPGNADARTACKVLKRTAKFVVLNIDGFGLKRCTVRAAADGEYATPLGTAYLAPTVRARRTYKWAD
ncbi:MAG: hypothetical protein CMH53_04580 [Myxococcales bacterium]|nr:hypothetical protein [Myxococcales bacterium]